LQYLLSICNIFWPFAIYFDHWEYLMTIGNILWSLGIFLRPFGIVYVNLLQFLVIWYIFPFWYVWTKKNLATLLENSNICVGAGKFQFQDRFKYFGIRTKVTSLGEFSPVDRFLPSDNSMKFT
jgi:hypothetical protein